MAHVNEISWHITPFRPERWLEKWSPAAERMPAFGAKSWVIYRSIDDPLLFRQVSVWDSKSDFEAYWYSEEITAARAEIIDLYDKILLPAWNQWITGS